MLTIARSFAEPTLGARMSNRDWCTPSLRVRVFRIEGMTYDESLLYPSSAWSGYGDRPRVDIVLDGTARTSENGTQRWLGPGDFSIGRALDSLYSRVHEGSTVLSIEWKLGTLGTNTPIGLPTGRLPAPTLERLRALSEPLHAPSESNRSWLSVMTDLFAELRSAGLPFDAWHVRDLVVPVSSALQRVADAIGRQLSRLHHKPQSHDLEQALGLSRRRIVELTSALLPYGLNGQDWRTMRDRYRLGSSLVAMSHPLARTEQIARAVGFGSPNAFCHALREAGLPTPGSVRERLALLS